MWDAHFLRGVCTSVQGLFVSVRAVYSNVGQVYGARVQRRRTSVRGTCTTTVRHVYGGRIPRCRDPQVYWVANSDKCTWHVRQGTDSVLRGTFTTTKCVRVRVFVREWLCWAMSRRSESAYLAAWREKARCWVRSQCEE